MPDAGQVAPRIGCGDRARSVQRRCPRRPRSGRPRRTVRTTPRGASPNFPRSRPARISRRSPRGTRIWRAPFVTVAVAQPTGRAVTRPAPLPTRPRASHVAARVPLALSSRRTRARPPRSSRALTSSPSPPSTVTRAKRRCRAPRSGLPSPGRWAAPDDAGSARDGRHAGRRSPDDDATPGRAAGRSSRRGARRGARDDETPAGDDAPATDGSRDAPRARRDGTADRSDVADARRRRRSAPDRVDARGGDDAAGAPARSARRGSHRRRHVEL